MNQASKLVELRAKTDRDLIALIRNRLTRELASAATEPERRRLQSKLSRLDELPDDEPPVQAAWA